MAFESWRLELLSLLVERQSTNLALDTSGVDGKCTDRRYHWKFRDYDRPLPWMPGADYRRIFSNQNAYLLSRPLTGWPREKPFKISSE